MKRCLIETSVLARLANKDDKQRPDALRAIGLLQEAEIEFCILPQSLVEFYVVATRPLDVNGLGATPGQALTNINEFLSEFTLLSENEAFFDTWRHLVETEAVLGKQAHDARLVAGCQVHEVEIILTFNVRHFARLTTRETRITVIDASFNAL